MRVSYWDNWKGIAIIAVVAIHASGSTRTFQEGTFNWLFGLTLRQIIDFAVPLFLAMSGYFSVKGSDENILEYYKSRFARIIIPYMIWTAIYIFLNDPKNILSFSELFKGLIFGTGIGIGYFVIVLSQFVALTPIFSKIERKSHHVAIMVVMSAIGTAFVYYFSAFNQEHVIAKFPLYALPFFVWYPFYHVGYFIARYQDEIIVKGTFKRLAVCGFAFFLMLSLLEGLFWAYKQNYSFGVSQLKATSLASSLFLFFIVLSLKDGKTLLDRHSPLTWLGANSYAIYLIHMLFLRVVQRLLTPLDSIYSLQPLFILLSTAMVILLCAAFIKTSSLIVTQSISKKLLGS